MDIQVEGVGADKHLVPLAYAHPLMIEQLTRFAREVMPAFGRQP